MGARLISRIPKIAAAARLKTDAAKANAAQHIADTARANAPVDEGELRDSISVSDSEVAATAEHSIYVEYGTSDTPAQPFLTPAAEEARGPFIRAMGQVVK